MRRERLEPISNKEDETTQGTPTAKSHYFSYDNVARVRQLFRGWGSAMKKKSPLVIEYCGGGRYESEGVSALTNKQQRKNERRTTRAEMNRAKTK